MRPLAPRTRALLLALGLFALGLVCGAAADRWVIFRWGGPFHPPFGPRPPEERLMRRLTSNLDVSPEQEREIREILGESRDTAHRVQRETRNALDTLARDTRTRIRNVLTPEQQQKYDDYLKLLRRMERSERRQQRFQPPGGP